MQKIQMWPYAELRRDAVAAGQAQTTSWAHGTTARQMPHIPQAGEISRQEGTSAERLNTSERNEDSGHCSVSARDAGIDTQSQSVSPAGIQIHSINP